jgi:uncharacterized protein
LYEERIYRNMIKGISLEFFNVRVNETDLMIGTRLLLHAQALECVKKYRMQIENYIKNHELFLKSLSPIEAETDAPEIIKRMSLAGQKAGVGPMASVAGAISEMTGMELLNYSDEVIVENGGDIFIKTSIPRKVGIFAGDSILNEKIALKILPEDTPSGICTSSGKVGHSLSFGKSDATVVISRDCFLADAVATAAGNMVKSKIDMENAVDFAKNIKGVDGLVIIVEDKMNIWGDVNITSF